MARSSMKSGYLGLFVGFAPIAAVVILVTLQPHSQGYFRSRYYSQVDNDNDDDDYLTSDGRRQRKLQTEIVSFGGRPSRFRLPLQNCQGDCDSDNECAAGLACFQRGPYTAVPSCIGGLRDSSRTDYCVPNEFVYGGGPMPPPPTPPPPTPSSPTPSPVGGGGGLARIKRIGNNLDIELGLCEGDCDSDNDCEGQLECYQRRSRFEPVHGCVGGETDRSFWDYCVNPSNPNPTPTPPTTGGTPPSSSSTDVFRLKLFWQPGYFWQEETRERRWCAMHQYEGLPGNGLCWYGRTRSACRDDQLYIAKCSRDDRQLFQFIDVNNDEVLIALASASSGGRDLLCWQREGRQIFLRSCDTAVENQRWFAPNGSFSGPKFEFSQRRFSSQCITQDHHPKAGEVVELHSCRAARSDKHETSFWNKDY